MSHEPPLNGNGKGWNWSQIGFFSAVGSGLLLLMAFGYSELKGIAATNQADIKGILQHEVLRNNQIEKDAAELKGRVDTYEKLFLAGKLKGTE